MSLSREAMSELLVHSHLVAHDLDRDVAVQPVVESLVHDSHAALAEDVDYLVSAVKHIADISVVFVHRSSPLPCHRDNGDIVAGAASERRVHKEPAKSFRLGIVKCEIKYLTVRKHI